MKRMNLTITIDVDNDRFDDSRVEKKIRVNHTVDVDLLLHDYVYTCVENAIKDEFNANLNDAIKTIAKEPDSESKKSEPIKLSEHQDPCQ